MTLSANYLPDPRSAKPHLELGRSASMLEWYPGITYMNLALNYSASQLNNSNGNAITGLAGKYSFWVDENIFMYVPKYKFLGAYFAPYISVNVANGSLVADIVGTNLGANGGGAGLADTYVQPLNLGWHLKRAEVNLGYAFLAPTGRYTAGASNNVGSGYWGNDLTMGTTVYLTKKQGNQRKSLHGLGDPREKTGGHRQQHHACSGLHGGVGTWTGSSFEEGHEQASAVGPRGL